jgi:superfamily II DNA/RNA helicase
MKAEDYVHRIGRTGRAGRSGLAVTLATRDDVSMIRRIQQFTTQTIPSAQIEGLEPKTQEPRIFPPRPMGAGGFEDRGAPRPSWGAKPAYGNKSFSGNKSFGNKPFNRDGGQPFNRDAGRPAAFEPRGEFRQDTRPEFVRQDARPSFDNKPFERSNDRPNDRSFAPRGDRPSFGAAKPSFGQDRRPAGPGAGPKRSGPFSPSGPRRSGFGR